VTPSQIKKIPLGRHTCVSEWVSVHVCVKFLTLRLATNDWVTQPNLTGHLAYLPSQPLRMLRLVAMLPTMIAYAYHYLQQEICAIKQGMCIMIIVRCSVINVAFVTKITAFLETFLYYKRC
jgi:hypothetical protein